MGSVDYTGDPLWPILVETVHAMIMYPHHKSFVRDVILHEKADVSPQDLVISMDMPLGEALVIMSELRMEKTYQPK